MITTTTPAPYVPISAAYFVSLSESGGLSKRINVIINAIIRSIMEQQLIVIIHSVDHSQGSLTSGPGRGDPRGVIPLLFIQNATNTINLVPDPERKVTTN